MDLGENASGGMGGGAFSQFGGPGSTPRGFQPVISSGPDSIEVGGGEKKSRKWVVVLLIVLLFIVAGGGIFALWESGVFGGNSNNQIVAIDDFKKYRNLIVYGVEDLEQSEESELGSWAFDEIIETSTNSIENKDYLTSVKSNYDLYWEKADKNKKIMGLYDQFFRLFYYIADRNSMIANLVSLGKEEAKDYVERILGGEDWDEQFTALVFAEKKYFENYDNQSEAGGYLAQAMDSIGLMKNVFKKMTDNIYKGNLDDNK